MVGRILHYLGLIWMREQTPVLPIVLYLFPTSVPVMPWRMDGPEGIIALLNFRIIKLWEEPVAEWLATGQSGILIFTALLKGATIESFGQAADTLLQLPDVDERGNALNFLVMFAIRKFGRDPVLAYIKEHLMLDTFIAESEWYQEILRRGTAEGQAKGMAQGEQRGAQRMAQRALEGRFGEVPQDVLDALVHADEAMLEAIMLHITTDSIQQVRERLGLATQP